MVETELAVITFVDDAMMISRRELGHVTRVFINSIQQRIEGGTEIEAAAAAVAYVIDPQGILLQVLRVDRVDQGELCHGGDRVTRAASSNQRGYPIAPSLIADD